MTNTFEILFIFFIILIGGWFAITSISQNNSLTLGNCNWNDTSGHVQNCTLSDNDYKMLNSSAAQSGTILTVFSNLNWITLATLLMSCLILMTLILKK